MGYEEFLHLTDRYGVALVVLIMLGLALWRIIKWCGPRIDRIVDAHVEMVRGVTNSVDGIKAALPDVCRAGCSPPDGFKRFHDSPQRFG